MDASPAPAASQDEPGLSAIPETMLWTLHNRASEAQRPDAVLHDPDAVRIYQSIDYDYVGHFGKADGSHGLRSRVFDDALRPWLAAHPGGTVVELGAGLETQCRRCDDGRVHWVAVDVPEALAMRERFLPPTDRFRHVARSALDLAWMDEVGPTRGVFVTAQGLLMYFEEAEVRRLLTAIFDRFPGVEVMCDAIPPWLSRKTLKGWARTRTYITPPMPWGIRRDDVEPTLRAWSPRVTAVEQVPFGYVRGLAGRLLPFISRTPRLRNLIPSVVRVWTAPGPAGAPRGDAAVAAVAAVAAGSPGAGGRGAPGDVFHVIADPRVAAVLRRLHAEADRQTPALLLHYLPQLPRLLRGRPLPFDEDQLWGFYADKSLPLERAQARFLYLTARALRATSVVEFGTSYGVSAIWLGAAVRANGGGRVVGTELVPAKSERARRHIAEAGLADVVEVRAGDALETLQDGPGEIDLLLNDGFPMRALDVLRLLAPRLRPAGVVLTDNVGTFPANYSAYLAYLRDPGNGFASATLPFKSGTEFSVRVAPPAPATIPG